MSILTVTECANGMPMNGALVTDTTQGVAGYTDPQGQISLSSASGGDIIEVQQSGYTPKTFSYTGQNASICLELGASTGTGTSTGTSGCIIASACLGEDADEVARLRKIRDNAISTDPVARDFFHVFWSRYYEWSPGVARLANADAKIADHIRWGFLDPWLSWLEFVSLLGQRPIEELTNAERDVLLERLAARRTTWLAELPSLLEEKRPADDQEVYRAFERFRAAARVVFGARYGEDAGPREGTGLGDGRAS
jgi:hypothetical protein